MRSFLMVTAVAAVLGGCANNKPDPAQVLTASQARAVADDAKC
jgi:outer membrane lipoprotein SlyB